MGYGCGWNDCGCSTVYTDAWGRPITGPGSGADGSATGGACGPNWGLLAFGALAALAAIAVAQPSKGK